MDTFLGSDVNDQPFSVEEDDDIQGQYERDAVQLARVDPAWFNEYCFRWTSWPFHEELHDLCTDHNRLVIFAPTEHGKTSQISIGRTTWELGRNTNLRAVLLSSTAELGKKSLSVIKQSILLNPRVKQVFPWLKPERRSGRTKAWLHNRIIVEREDLTNKDYSCQAIGVEGAILGSRVDLMILDDVMDFLNTATPLQREKVIEWLKTTAFGRLAPRSRLWCIGTCWFDDDAMHWMERNEVFHAKRYDADDNLWPELEVVDGREVGWPAWRLEERRKEVGSIEYGRQMRNVGLSDSMSIFKGEWIDVCMNLSGRTAFPTRYESTELLVVTGVDLGVKELRKGKSRGARMPDETVFFTLGLTRTGFYEVLDIRAGRMELPDILRMEVEVYQAFGSSIFVVESNAAQEYVVQFHRRLDDVAEILGVDVAKSVMRHIRVEPFVTNVNKHDPDFGVRGMVPDFELQKWRIPRNAETLTWKQELQRYRPSAHMGDRVAASWFAWTRLRNDMRRGRIRARTVGGKQHGQPSEQANAPAAPNRGPRIRRRVR